MLISVIIPTHNRRTVLARSLEALSVQVRPFNTFETVVVDDGSTDGTWDWVQANLDAYPFRLRSLRQPNQGPAAARNRGLKAAHGDLILFLGDDILATPYLLSRHLAWHADFPDPKTAIMGQVQWHPDLSVTSLMHWLEAEGVQWRFAGLEAGERLSYGRFITANLSVKRSLLLEAGGFDEGFPDAALEDSELGYRLCRQGLEIRYAPDALAYHWHPTTLDGLLARSCKIGRAAVYFAQLWPQLQRELLDPAVWCADRPAVVRSLLPHLARWRWPSAVLLPLTRWLACRPPWRRRLQPVLGLLYSLIVHHYRLLGIDSE